MPRVCNVACGCALVMLRALVTAQLPEIVCAVPSPGSVLACPPQAGLATLRPAACVLSHAAGGTTDCVSRFGGRL